MNNQFRKKKKNRIVLGLFWPMGYDSMYWWPLALASLKGRSGLKRLTHPTAETGLVAQRNACAPALVTTHRWRGCHRRTLGLGAAATVA
jgi:hypothetical protein